jgi:hypothetical protein
MVVSRLLEENKKKSKISVNCFLAIGAYVGYKMVIQDQENDYGVDVLLWNQIERNGHIRDLSTVLQFQLKSTQNYRIEKDEIVYHIENKTFNDIAQRNIIQSTPLIVVILILPQESEIDWISINENDIRFRRSLYWYHNDLRLYLQKFGWIENQTNKAGITVFTEPIAANPAEIFLPINEKDKLVEQYIKEAINILSFINNIDPILISNTITKLDRDLINYRVCEQNNDSIPVTFLEELLKSSKNSLKSASRIEYANYFKGLDSEGKEKHLSPLKHLEYYLNNLSFAHTWKGSFGVTIENPLEAESLGLFKLEDSVGRKTTKRVFNSYNLVNEATIVNSSNYILEHIESKDEVQVLSPYLSLIESIKEINIKVSFNFSPIIDIEGIDKPGKPFMLNKKSFRLLDDALSQLTTEVEEIEIAFIGFPEVMRSPMDSLLEESVLFESERIVTVRGVSPETGTASLRMVLSLENYRKALKAQDTVKYVKVKCKVKRRLKGWEVLSVDSFDLLE